MDCWKSPALVPEMVMFEMRKAASPVLVMVMVCSVLVVEAVWLPKESELG